MSEFDETFKFLIFKPGSRCLSKSQILRISIISEDKFVFSVLLVCFLLLLCAMLFFVSALCLLSVVTNI